MTYNGPQTALNHCLIDIIAQHPLMTSGSQEGHFCAV